MQPQQYQPAGDAQEVRPTAPINPIGLYRNPYTGFEVGVTHEIQGDAVIRQGFVLVEEGRDAAMKTQEQMDKDREKFLKSGGNNPEILELQARLAEAQAALAERDAANANANTPQTKRETSTGQAPDASDSAADQSQLVPERNIKAPVERPGAPEAPKGADLKAARAAKEEAGEAPHTAEQDLEAAGALNDDGQAAKQAEEDDAAPRGVDENASLAPADNAGDQLAPVFQSAGDKTPAEEESKPAPKNAGKASK